MVVCCNGKVFIRIYNGDSFTEKIKSRYLLSQPSAAVYLTPGSVEVCLAAIKF